MRHFVDYRCAMNLAFETASIPFVKKREMLTALRVTVLAHSNGTLKLQTNLRALLNINPELKSLISSQTGIDADQRLLSDGCRSVRQGLAG